MEIVWKRLEELTPYENNPRKNDNAVEAVAASIKEFGFLVPVIIDGHGEIVAGHTRLKAAEQLGLSSVPCLVAEELSEEQVRAYRLADNKIAELANWDVEKLKEELAAIEEINMDAFCFGFFREEPPQKIEENPVAKLDEGGEIDISSFGDDVFDLECPYCGFRWNR